MSEDRFGKVYLVGAGPGDPGLITVRGLELLRAADCVVYDRLAAPELLSVTTPDCEKIYVGKAAGQHYKTQDEINEILVDVARRHRLIVRLKGGDSFVFGRGGEEILRLEEEDIPYELVPGITSAVAVPELAGIPVTHRGVARSFHVITGHLKSEKGNAAPAYDYETIARMEGTIVFLMGLSNLREIADELMRYGKDAFTPAAVISDGTTPFQRTVRGVLYNIAERVEKANLPSPAIIVVGDVADFQFDSKETREKVGVVATDALWTKLRSELDTSGYLPIRIGEMEVVPQYEEEFEAAVQRSREYDWMVFTSQNAIRLYFEKAKTCGLDYRELAGVRFACIGSGTAAALRKYGFHADFVPEEYTVEALSEELANMITQEMSEKAVRVFIPHAAQGNPILAKRLRAAGAEVTDICIYDVKGRLNDAVDRISELQTLLFVSASGVRAFAEEMQELPPNLRIACIGRVTAEEVKKYFHEADIVATVNDVQGVVQALGGELW